MRSGDLRMMRTATQFLIEEFARAARDRRRDANQKIGGGNRGAALGGVVPMDERADHPENARILCEPILVSSNTPVRSSATSAASAGLSNKL